MILVIINNKCWILGTIIIQNVKTRVLFDSGATHSFISPYFAKKLGKDRILMKCALEIFTPLGESIEVQNRYSDFVVKLKCRELLADLIELPVLDFDVILVMD